MKIGIVTTFSDKGYEEYAKEFLSTVKKYLDKQIHVYLYVDNVPIEINGFDNIKILKLEDSIPELTNFKNRHKDKKFKTFLNDAVRFSHKSYAIAHASKHCYVETLIWLDADTELKKEISSSYLEKFTPKGIFSSYLGRPGRYTETGFISFDLTHTYAREFFDNFQNYYDKDLIYTELNEQTDCHVYDAVRLKMENENKIKCHNLTPGLGKNNFNNTFAGYMVHYKGDKKFNKNYIKVKK